MHGNVKKRSCSIFTFSLSRTSLTLCRSRPRRILKLADTQPLLNHTSLSQSRRQYHITLWCVWWWCKRRMHAHWFGSSSGVFLSSLWPFPHSLHSLTAQSWANEFGLFHRDVNLATLPWNSDARFPNFPSLWSSFLISTTGDKFRRKVAARTEVAVHYVAASVAAASPASTSSTLFSFFSPASPPPSPSGKEGKRGRIENHAKSSVIIIIIVTPRPFLWEFWICLHRFCLSSVHPMSQ